ncbi:MAG: hypothetical protein ACREBD_22720 [Blastocatellia bacterium]
MPDLVKWQRKYRGRGLQVIGVTYPPEELAEVRKFTKRIKVIQGIIFPEEFEQKVKPLLQ